MMPCKVLKNQVSAVHLLESSRYFYFLYKYFKRDKVTYYISPPVIIYTTKNHSTLDSFVDCLHCHFCVQYKTQIQFLSFECGYPVFQTSFIEDSPFPILEYWCFYSALVGHICVGSFRDYLFCVVVYVSIFMPVPYCFQYSCFYYNLKS